MIRKITLFLLVGWGALVAMVLTVLWTSDSDVLNVILQWTIPALLVLSVIFSTAMAVRHNLRTSNHFPGFSGLLPVHTAIEVIGKWGVRW